MGISDEIELIVRSLTDNNYPPQIVTITETYPNKLCDINTRNGRLLRVPCSNLTVKGSQGLLLYPEGNVNQPFVLPFINESSSLTLGSIVNVVQKGYADVQGKNQLYRNILIIGDCEIGASVIILPVDDNYIGLSNNNLDLSSYYSKSDVDLKDYVKKEDVQMKVDLQDNGVISIRLDIGEGY